MAITFDTSNFASNTDGSPIVIPLTVSASPNRLLAVSVASRSIGMAASGITFNGDALTLAVDIDAGFNQANVWYLINPDAVAGNVTVTFPAGVPVAFAACAVSLLGVAQSSPVDVADSNSGTSAIASLSGLATTTNGCAILDGIYVNGGMLVMLADTNRVERMNVSPSGLAGASTIITKSPAGSSAMQWDLGADFQWSLAAVAFKPFVAPTGFSGGNPDNILIGQPRFANGGPSIGMGF